MSECIRAMERMFIGLAQGKARIQKRSIIQIPRTNGSLAIMPAIGKSAASAKVMTIYPQNAGTRFETHQGVVLLFDSKKGRLLAVLDSTSVTAIRTAAVSAVATKLLSKRDSSRLAILGSGAQASAHLRAIPLVRNIDRIKVWSRNFEHAKSLVRRTQKDSVVAVKTVEEAVSDTDIICTVTSSTKPILKGRWIKQGAHINAVGAYTRNSRELDSEAVKKSVSFVDSRESANFEAGDFLIPKSQGIIRGSHIRGELGDLLTGKVRGRTNDRQITLFKSLGLATEDLAAAEKIYSKASTLPGSIWVQFGKERSVY